MVVRLGKDDGLDYDKVIPVDTSKLNFLFLFLFLLLCLLGFLPLRLFGSLFGAREDMVFVADIAS